MAGSMAYSAELVDGNPLVDLTTEYLDLLLAGERRLASKLVLDSVAEGVGVKDIYLHVFQRSQHEIGRLWQTNKVNVAQEHFCTASTQLIMSQLYPYIFSTDRNGKKLVATCVGGELHEIGVRMVADFFEMAGWDTYYLGANAPVDSILQSIEMQSADLLAISVTITFNVSKVADMIKAIKDSQVAKSTRILVGGRPFIIAPGLWHTVGADGFAVDAEQAIDIATDMLN